MKKSLVQICILLLFSHTSRGMAETKNLLSPDGQWRYECAEGHWPEIQRVSTGQRALDLLGEIRSVPYPDNAEVVWSPDSKRLAFNYSPPHAPHSTYVTTAFYQLRDGEWISLPSPVDEDSPKKTFAVLSKHLPQGMRLPRLWRGDPNRLVFRARSWVDADTATLFVYTAGVGSGRSDSPRVFSFTLKFDPAGRCRIVGAEKITEKEIEH